MKERKFKMNHYTYVMRSDGTWYGPVPSLYATLMGCWVEFKWRRSLKSSSDNSR